jgi:hypothetical protein
MLITAASRPFAVMSNVRSGAPITTSPRSPTRTTEPPLSGIGVAPMSASERHCPVASARYCRPDAAYRPTGARTFVEPSAVATSPTDSPDAASRAGSTMTSTSRRSLADTSRRPTPGARASAGRIT